MEVFALGNDHKLSCLSSRSRWSIHSGLGWCHNHIHSWCSMCLRQLVQILFCAQIIQSLLSLDKWTKLESLQGQWCSSRLLLCTKSLLDSGSIYCSNSRFNHIYNSFRISFKSFWGRSTWQRFYLCVEFVLGYFAYHDNHRIRWLLSYNTHGKNHLYRGLYLGCFHSFSFRCCFNYDHWIYKQRVDGIQCDYWRTSRAKETKKGRQSANQRLHCFELSKKDQCWKQKKN